MNLANYVKSLFFEQCYGIIPPVEEIGNRKQESLLAVVVPKKVLTAPGYKSRGVVVSGELGRYVHGCALDIGRALLAAYDDFFDVATTERDQAVAYEFKRGERTVTYALMGIPNFESIGGQLFSSDITGLLRIQEPKLDFQRAGAFLTAVMENNLLDYREHTGAKFGVFYEPGEDKENRQKLEGIPLLQQLGVTPTEAAEFFQIMYFGGYEHKIFKPGELN